MTNANEISLPPPFYSKQLAGFVSRNFGQPFYALFIQASEEFTMSVKGNFLPVSHIRFDLIDRQLHTYLWLWYGGL
jgi:hypothetical protein